MGGITNIQRFNLRNDGRDRFMCRWLNCNVFDGFSSFGIDYPDLLVDINADTQENLQNSFVLTEVPFETSSYLPIGFLGVVVGINYLLQQLRAAGLEPEE